jgi:hypothetical protein
MTHSSHLFDALNKIWKSTADPMIQAKNQVALLSQLDVTLLAAWDTAGILHITPTNFLIESGQSNSFTILSKGPQMRGHLEYYPPVTPGPMIIRYTDLGRGVIIDSGLNSNIPTAYEHSLASLLYAAQLIRDHVDSMLFLPPTMRQDRLSEFACRTALSVKHFRALAQSFTALSAAVDR